MNRLILFLAAVFTLASCNNKYAKYKSQYTFRSADGKPDFSQLNYWAAHPQKWDPSDSIPKPLRNQPRDSMVDVFFMYPTTFTSLKSKDIGNAAIDDDLLNAKTDYTTILYQASVFNQQCRVFAPRYRQAHIKNFFRTDKEKAANAFDVAYSDLKNAFEYYLQHWNNGRPIIIAGHSQGALMAERLLKEYFEGKPLMNKLVVAYVVGWPVAKDLFTMLPMCKDSLQTSCACSWRTFRRGYVPFYLKKEKGNVFVTNPITWTTGNEYASRRLNQGSVLVKFNKVYTKTTDAQIDRGLLFVKRPKFPGSFFYFTKNYHIGDINLFYVNIQEDIKRRISLYWKR
jgi:Protein of unknown function (DUF3089)